MRLATIRVAGGTRAARVEGETLIPVDATDVGDLLGRQDWEVIANGSGAALAVADADFAPVVPRPSKVFCVGINYRNHMIEMGHELPEYPTLFAKFANCLIGAHDDLVLPSVSTKVDWEGELGVVVGTRIRRGSTAEGAAAIAGYTVVNDVSMRDWQWRTSQWLQGKAFETSTPVGPYMVTPDEVDGARDLELRCEVDGNVRQQARTSHLLFGPAAVVSYISQFTTLEPGDLIATGTPGGVGAARTPPIFLAPGQTLRTTIEGIGECVNACREDKG